MLSLAVFDDGDERTLKRSSLCLKGGRHFHESESLDHLPLTDPENFGTPVNTSSKKPGRRRRHVSQSPPWESTSKKNFRSPSEFTVGLELVPCCCVCVWGGAELIGRL